VGIDLGPEAREVLAMMLPNGHNLREVVDAYHAATGAENAPFYHALNRLPILQPLEDAQVTAQTRSGEVVLYIRRLARRTHDGEAEAAFVLALIALEATLHLNWISRESHTIAELAPHMPLWPIIWSPVSTMKTTKDLMAKLNVGADFIAAKGTETRKIVQTDKGHKWGKASGKRGARPNVASKATFYAAAVACYMLGIRGGVSSSIHASWADKVRRLPPFSGGTVNLWWPLALEEINRSYPDIARVIYGGSLRKGKQEALRTIREAFQNIWKVFG
jgi:hypothetical protein